MSVDVVFLERVWPPAAAGGSISQFGGWPNLPTDWSWPRIRFNDGSSASLDFLAQIDLAELPEVSQRALLPAAGTLYFFALSQSHVPLAEFGPDAARVLYHPGQARSFPRRPPPPDAGWGQDELHHTRTVAAQFRDTDAARGALFPRCPIRAIAATAREAATPPAIDTDFKYRNADLPLRVEDALLHINFARNSWRENILPFSTLRDHLKKSAEAALACERNLPKWSRGMLAQRATYVDNALSDAFWPSFESDYSKWRERAVALRRRLLDLGRPTLLNDVQRASVRTLVTEADALKRKIEPYGLLFSSHQKQASKMALATLLMDHPEAAIDRDELRAAQPRRSRHGGHRMLGPPNEIQSDTLTGHQPILLLQLDSESCGPRFSWWDAGNLTFWISASDAAKGRFDAARAEIEGN